jgi:hypothetical protein
MLNVGPAIGKEEHAYILSRWVLVSRGPQKFRSGIDRKDHHYISGTKSKHIVLFSPLTLGESPFKTPHS